MFLDNEYESIVALAKEVGLYQKSMFRTKGLKQSTKSTEVDIVTEVDLKSDEKIVSTIKSLFPDDNILSEEQGYFDKGSAYTWVIDPLDGTTNFSIGLPIFAVSIARMCDGVPVFGVVYLPMVDDLFVAVKGGGATLNGEPLKIGQQNTLNKCVLATGFPYDRATAINNNSKNIEKMIPLVKGVRRMGAAAYDLCLVAAGILDGFWELRLGLWDIAAAWLMITEAGGIMDVRPNDKGYNVIAGNADVCMVIDEVVNLENA